MSLRTKNDQAALQTSIIAARAEDAGRAAQIDLMLASGRDWIEVAKFASYCAQSTSLHLQPWQDPPCVIDLDSAMREPFGDQRALREGGELLRRMLERGISKFHPSPIDALDRAEERKAAQ